MRKSIFYFATLIFFATSSRYASSQDCDFYFLDKKGASAEITYYDKKQKETGVGKVTVLEFSTTGEGKTAKVSSVFKPAGDAPESKHTFDLACKNGEFYLNMDAYVNDESLSAYKNMEIQVDHEQMTLPASLKSGQVLKDGRVTVKVMNNGIKIFTMNSFIKNRKVEGFEKVTTPAGTFDCVKVSYTLETKFMFKTMKINSKEWFAKNIGVVKTESYNKKGKLDGSSLLTKLER